MILNISNGSPMTVANGFLEDEKTHETSLDANVSSWDLSQLIGVETIDGHESDLSRKKKARSSNVKKNMLFGAVLGGVIDFSIGDDSILGGATLGAAAGWFMSDSSEDPEAYILLMFASGERLALKVSREGLSKLLARDSNEDRVKVSTAKSTRKLTSDEVIWVKKARESRSKLVVVFCSMLFGTMGYLLLSYLLRPAAQYTTVPGIIDDMLDKLKTIPLEVGSALLVGCLCSVIALTVRHFCNRKLAREG